MQVFHFLKCPLVVFSSLYLLVTQLVALGYHGEIYRYIYIQVLQWVRKVGIIRELAYSGAGRQSALATAGH
jgi:hypothetical protein